MERADGATYLNIGIALADGLADHLIAIFEDGADDVLVADAQILQMEGLGMACVGTHTGPLVGGGVGIGPLDEMAQFVDIGRNLIHRNASLLSTNTLGVGGRVLAGYAGSQHGQGLSADVFAKLEILEEAQSACLMVIPDVEVGLALLQQTHGVLPMIDIVETLSVRHASAREAHELRMQGGNGLGQVLTHTVLATFEGVLREERDHIHAHVSCLQGYDDQPGLVVGGCGSEHGGILFPVAGTCLERALGQHIAVLSDQQNVKVLLLSASEDIHGEIVFFAHFNGDSVPSFVPQGVRPQQCIVRIVGMQGMLGSNLYGPRRMPGCGGIPAAMVLLRIFEVAILDELGIEAAVGSIADILKEDADELVADGLGAVGTDAEGCVDDLRQMGQAFLVVVHPLSTETAIFLHFIEECAQLLHLVGGDGKLLPVHQAAIDGNAVALPYLRIGKGHRHIIGKAAEIP